MIIPALLLIAFTEESEADFMKKNYFLEDVYFIEKNVDEKTEEPSLAAN